MKRIISNFCIFVLLLSCNAFCATSDYHVVSSNSVEASIPSGSLAEINSAEAEYNTASFFYKTLAQQRIDLTILAAYALVGGGALASYPDASSCLSHFLDNTGTKITNINFNAMLSESTSYNQYTRMISELDELISATETLAHTTPFRVVEYEQDTNPNSAQGNNWFYSIGKYRTWSFIYGTKTNGTSPTYRGTITYHLEDYYNWDPNAGGYFLGILTTSLWELHYTGNARNYEISSSATIPILWEKGERIQSGEISLSI